MSLTNIKNMKDERGFTLVELLIVIIIIAILAAITIVAYNGITDRANNSSAQDAASQLRTKVLAWQSVKGSYPAASDVTSGLVDTEAPEAKLDDNLKAKAQATSTTTVSKDVPLFYAQCSTGTPSAVTGAKITYWQTGGTTSAPKTATYVVGNC